MVHAFHARLALALKVLPRPALNIFRATLFVFCDELPVSGNANRSALYFPRCMQNDHVLGASRSMTSMKEGVVDQTPRNAIMHTLVSITWYRTRRQSHLIWLFGVTSWVRKFGVAVLKASSQIAPVLF